MCWLNANWRDAGIVFFPLDSNHLVALVNLCCHYAVQLLSRSWQHLKMFTFLKNRVHAGSN